jgi:hypothetical protein
LVPVLTILIVSLLALTCNATASQTRLVILLQAKFYIPDEG